MLSWLTKVRQEMVESLSEFRKINITVKILVYNLLPLTLSKLNTCSSDCKARSRNI